jgi:hypothetical protein
MFELHVVVASVVMFNIIELIMEIVPNYPTLNGLAFIRPHGKDRHVHQGFNLLWVK